MVIVVILAISSKLMTKNFLSDVIDSMTADVKSAKSQVSQFEKNLLSPEPYYVPISQINQVSFYI